MTDDAELTAVRAEVPGKGRPEIAFIQAGGTIISLGANRLDYSAYGDTTVRMSAQEAVQRCPEVGEIAEIITYDFRKGGSRTLIPQDWISLSVNVREALLRPTCGGIVVSHGTNSLEETAYFLDLTLDDPRPVVVVGAMRPPNTLGTDAELNLLNAFRVATDPAAQDRGVMVVMDSLVISARDATKTSTYALNSFTGKDWGVLGMVGADGIVNWSRYSSPSHERPGRFALEFGRELPRVDILVSHVGADGRLIDAATQLGARGLVCAGTGAGVVTLAEEEALLRAVAKGTVVCLSSRVGEGFVLRTPSMLRNGFIAAGNLPPWKARILLSLALAGESDHEVIQERFTVN